MPIGTGWGRQFEEGGRGASSRVRGDRRGVDILNYDATDENRTKANYGNRGGDIVFGKGKRSKGGEGQA